jgi:hypothetical protein
MLKSLTTSLLFIFASSVFSQPDKIKIKKDDNSLYFFQVGTSSDTISSGKNDIFYFKLSKDKRCATRVEVENGQLLKLNDTTLKLIYIPHLNYLHNFADSIFINEEKNSKGLSRYEQMTIEKCSIYKSMINGTNSSPNSRAITIRFIENFDNKAVLSNAFYYR